MVTASARSVPLILRLLLVPLLLLLLRVGPRSGTTAHRLHNSEPYYGYDDGYYSNVCWPSVSRASGRFALPPQPSNGHQHHHHHLLCRGQLIFNETFETLRTSLWHHERRLGGYGGEFSWYMESGAVVENGVLEMRSALTADIMPDIFNCNITVQKCTGYKEHSCRMECSADEPAPPVRNGRLHTRGSFGFRYGRVQIRAQLPTGDWLFPALWMLPVHSRYGGWPRSGEIDLMESRGNAELWQDGVNVGVGQFSATLHFGPDAQTDGWREAHFVRSADESVGGFNRRFHVYEMEWTPDHFIFSIDGHHVGTVRTDTGYFDRGQFTGENPWRDGGRDAPFDQEFYFVISMPTGGTSGYFTDTLADKKPWRNDAPTAQRDFWEGREQWLPTWRSDDEAGLSATMKVDWIRVYAL